MLPTSATSSSFKNLVLTCTTTVYSKYRYGRTASGPVLSKNLQLTLPDLGYQLGTALSAFTQDHRALTMPTLASYCIHARTMQYCTVRVPYCHIRVPYCQYCTCTVRVPWLRARNELGRVFSNLVWILAFCARFRPTRVLGQAKSGTYS